VGATFILIYKKPQKSADAAEALKFFAWAYAKGGKKAEETRLRADAYQGCRRDSEELAGDGGGITCGSFRISARRTRCHSSARTPCRSGQDLNLLRAPIGIVFQKQTPFPMSIFENIAFGIHLYEKLPRLELESQVERSLRRAAVRVSDLTAFMYLGGWRSPIRPAWCSRRCATGVRRTTSPVGVNDRSEE
jgi:hypothetical protein